MAFYPQHQDTFLKALESLKNRPVVVLGHKRPDGDCIGSQVALCRVLNAKGFHATAINADPIPPILKSFIGDTPFIPAAEKDSRFNIHTVMKGAPCEETPVAITVDCADPKRVGDALYRQFPEVLLNIDHHISNPKYAARNIIVAQASSVGEVLAGLFFDNDLPVDPVTAQALYVAIATDTQQFCVPSLYDRVFEICRQLCECGAKPSFAALELYEKQSFGKRKLLQHFLSSLERHFDNRVCIGKLEEGIYERTGACTEDSEGLVDYARAIEGVDIGVLVEERNGAIKGSLRAKDPAFRVDRIAKIFGGGGHAAAAGFNIEATPLDVFYPRLLEALQTHLASMNGKDGAPST